MKKKMKNALKLRVAKNKMKLKWILITLTLLAFSGCSLLEGGPAKVVRKYHQLASDAKLQEMDKLFSAKALKERSEKAIHDANFGFMDTVLAMQQNGLHPRILSLSEKTAGDKSVVTYRFGDDSKKSNSFDAKCELRLENGDWKIETIGSSTTP
jgi:ABC-type oligopeptide transport system substrate-binding subunit